MGKELIFQTLRHEQTNEIPWVPFAGVHVGKLKGYTAEEVLRDEDKLVECLLEANKLYTPDGMPIIFDLQVEAEILGCELMWAENNPPSVKSHPLSGEKSIPCNCKIPTPESGRLPMILSAMRRVKAEIGDQTALYGLICGPFTLASHLRGTDIFMDMVSDSAYVKELVNYCCTGGHRHVADVHRRRHGCHRRCRPAGLPGIAEAHREDALRRLHGCI